MITPKNLQFLYRKDRVKNSLQKMFMESELKQDKTKLYVLTENQLSLKKKTIPATKNKQARTKYVSQI